MSKDNEKILFLLDWLREGIEKEKNLRALLAEAVESFHKMSAVSGKWRDGYLAADAERKKLQRALNKAWADNRGLKREVADLQSRGGALQNHLAALQGKFVTEFEDVMRSPKYHRAFCDRLGRYIERVRVQANAYGAKPWKKGGVK